ncbi:hypothetical protein R1sor_023496 [Riccia sorocarpa]|uniref:Reverse transcriptase zinc-binding domain-containing protein n=1 Tax=Riccia sorocarpa TaxID=122646 RepID=A0ABD3GR14_9MARC
MLLGGRSYDDEEYCSLRFVQTCSEWGLDATFYDRLQRNKKRFKTVEYMMFPARCTTSYRAGGKPRSLEKTEIRKILARMQKARRAVHHVSSWRSAPVLVSNKLADPELWEWRPGEGQSKWTRSVQEWKKLIPMSYDRTPALNRKWNLVWEEETWANMWKRLWESMLFPREKYWLWKIVQQRFFTMAKAHQIGVAEPTCLRCNRSTEDIEHIILRCRKVEFRWLDYTDLISRISSFRPDTTNIPNLMRAILQPTPAAVAWTICFTIHSRCAWKAHKRVC